MVNITTTEDGYFKCNQCGDEHTKKEQAEACCEVIKNG